MYKSSLDILNIDFKRQTYERKVNTILQRKFIHKMVFAMFTLKPIQRICERGNITYRGTTRVVKNDLTRVVDSLPKWYCGS